MTRSLFVLAGASCLTACTVGPDFHAQTPVAPPAATASQIATQMASATPIDREWWRVFADPAFDAVMTGALAGNFDLQVASARVQASRAQLRIAGAVGLPRAGGAASYMRERASGGTVNRSGTNGNADFDLLQTGFDASWELDQWGRARRLHEAGLADAQAAIYEREAPAFR